MPWIPSSRLANLLIAGIAAVAMAAALYLQHVVGLEPCPLCTFQRVAVICVGVIAFVAAVHGPVGWGRRLYAALTALAALGGIVVAGRHVWLQHLPADQVPACGPGLDYWMAAFPMQEVVRQVFQGSGECAKVDWTLLGVSLPGWTLVLFVALFGVACWQLLRRH